MKSGEFLGICAIAIILLGLAWTIAGPNTKVGKAWTYLTNGSGIAMTNQQSQPPAAGTSVVGGPSLSAAQVDTILANAGSPAQGSGQTFYNDSVQYGIDDAYALAFFKHESTYGLYGAAVNTRSIGNINCTAGYSCIGRFRAYPSWQAGIDDWYQLIKTVYVGQGLSTVEAIIPHYAPNSDHNNEAAYISSVENDVSTWRAA